MSLRNRIAKTLATASIYIAEPNASPDAYYDGTRQASPDNRHLATAKGSLTRASRQLTVAGRTLSRLASRYRPHVVWGPTAE